MCPGTHTHTILLWLYICSDLIDSWHKQMLIYDYITFWQLSVNEFVNYKQCLNSLRTTLVQELFPLLPKYCIFIKQKLLRLPLNCHQIFMKLSGQCTGGTFLLSNSTGTDKKFVSRTLNNLWHVLTNSYWYSIILHLL